MIEKIKTISNPLSIIAIFAGLAEISGTIVLPLLEPESQKIYLWFLMIFPSLLIALFFLTLNFNYKVLYAPSDFKDEDNFLKLFGNPTPEDRLAKLNEEIEEDVSKDEVEKVIQEGIVNPNTDSRYREIFRRNSTATYYLAEELALNKISNEFHDFKRELVLNSGKNNFMFDAVGTRADNVYAIEVKYSKDNVNIKSIRSSLNKINKVYIELPSHVADTFHVILAIVSDLPKQEMLSHKEELISLTKEHDYEVDIRMFNLAELEQELLSTKNT